MSPIDRPVPPAGEEIHLPGGSIQPVLLAVFITILLLGLTFHWIVLTIGLVGTLWVMFAWIRDARAELADLPTHREH